MWLALLCVHSTLQLAHLFMLIAILLMFISCCGQPQQILSLLLQEAGVYFVESTLHIVCARAGRSGHNAEVQFLRSQPFYLGQPARLAGGVEGTPMLDDVLRIRAVHCYAASTGFCMCYVDQKEKLKAESGDLLALTETQRRFTSWSKSAARCCKISVCAAIQKDEAHCRPSWGRATGFASNRCQEATHTLSAKEAHQYLHHLTYPFFARTSFHDIVGSTVRIRRLRKLQTCIFFRHALND